MSRARNIKPGFYKNEDLAECSIWARFIFPGLWMLADKEGRLEDRPKRIKGELLPFDTINVDPLLAELHAHGFIVRYQIEGISYIQISAFSKHQSPHYSEKESVIKAPTLLEHSGTFPETTGKEARACGEIPGILPESSGKVHPIKRGSQPPDSLIPDSLIPDSGKKQKIGASAVGSRLPAEWQLPEGWRDWAKAERPDVNAQAEADKFADYWHGKAGKDARKADWLATWRNWMRGANASPQRQLGKAGDAFGGVL